MVSRSSWYSPSDSSESTVARWLSTRITTFSPYVAGSVETRRSTGLPFTATRARPSCGRRRSAMSSPDMILMREMSGTPAERGIFITCRSTPSMRYRTTTPPSTGSMCTSLARLAMPSASIMSTSRTIGAVAASSAAAPRSSPSSSSSWVTSASSSPPRIFCTASSACRSAVRYSSSSRSRIVRGDASSIRTSRPVANASIFSASMSKGLAVATSRKESVSRSGSTMKRRTRFSGTASRLRASVAARSASGSRNRFASACRIWSSPASLRSTSCSHSDTDAPCEAARSLSTSPGGRRVWTVATSHSSVNAMELLRGRTAGPGRPQAHRPKLTCRKAIAVSGRSRPAPVGLLRPARRR